MNDYEISDEEIMITQLEELQRENDKLKQEIMRLNSSLIAERQQNEKLLELAKSEKQLHEQNEKLLREKSNLLQEVQNANSKADSLQKQLQEATSIPLPDEALLQRFTAAMRGVDDKVRDIMLVHWLNLAVVAVFVVLAAVSGYMSYSASKAAEKANTAVQNGIYDKDGWSMVPGAYQNEYTTATQRPDWYTRFKAQHPDQAHY